MKNLAIAIATRRKSKYASGGDVPGDSAMKKPMEGLQEDIMLGDEEGGERGNTAAIIDDEQGYDENDAKPKMLMMSSGGIAQRIMAKKMAKGGMFNQGDNMPVNDDIDNLSAETSMEGPLGEGMHEDDREDKIMVRKSMLSRIMSKLHSDNKG